MDDTIDLETLISQSLAHMEGREVDSRSVQEVKDTIAGVLLQLEDEGFIVPEPEITVDGDVVNVSFPLPPIISKACQ